MKAGSWWKPLHSCQIIVALLPVALQLQMRLFPRHTHCAGNRLYQPSFLYLNRSILFMAETFTSHCLWQCLSGTTTSEFLRWGVKEKMTARDNINILLNSFEYPENGTPPLTVTALMLHCPREPHAASALSACFSSSTWVPATYACPYTDHPDWCNSFHTKTLQLEQDLDIRGGSSVRKSDSFRAHFGGYVPKSDFNLFWVISQIQFPTVFWEQNWTWTKPVSFCCWLLLCAMIL